MAEAQTDGAEEKRSFKDKIAHPMPELREKLKETHLYDVKIKAVHAKNKIGKFRNLVNPNHRHDEQHEKETDEKRSRVRENHRFESFAPEREGNLVKWYVDGRDYFWVRALPACALEAGAYDVRLFL
jgi:phospholipase D1/2